MELTYWHRFAYMYLAKELDIAEIVKVWMINTYAGVIEDDTEKLIGINVLDNSLLNEALILGMLKAYPDGQPLKYGDLATIMDKHYNTIGNAVKRMLEKGYLDKQGVSQNGSIYTVVDDSHLPQWIVDFTAAIVEIETNPDVKKTVFDACKDIGFKRGLQVLKWEILEKFKISDRVKNKPDDD